MHMGTFLGGEGGLERGFLEIGLDLGAILKFFLKK